MRRESKYYILFLSVFLVLTLYIIKDYLMVTFSSILLSYIIYPIHKKTSEVLGRRLSAFLWSTLFLLFIMLFISFFLSSALNFLSKAIVLHKEFEKLNLSYIIDIEKQIYSEVIKKSTSILSFIPSFFLKTIVFISLLYYFLCDGEIMLEYVRKLLPSDFSNIFFETTSKILKAIIYGHFLTAFIQGILAGVVYIFLGVPYSLLFTLLTLLVAIIGLTPAIGYIPASFFLFYLGNYVGGVILLLFGLFVISSIDNIIKPHFASKFYDIHPAVFLLSIAGGVTVFGFVGTFLGPLIVGILKAVIVSYEGEKNDRVEG